SRLQEKHLHAGIFSQTVGQDASRRAGAGNDVVVHGALPPDAGMKILRSRQSEAVYVNISGEPISNREAVALLDCEPGCRTAALSIPQYPGRNRATNLVPKVTPYRPGAD